MNQKLSPVVLVVEDDWLLRLIAIEIVEDAGLVAIEAANADQAFAILECRADIALILPTSICQGVWMGLNSLTPCGVGGHPSKS
jgi:DNA-binding NtrC family response regulator